MAYNNGSIGGLQNGVIQGSQSSSVLGAALQRPVMPQPVGASQTQPQQQWNSSVQPVQQQSSQSASDHGQILSKQKLQELAREVDPTLQLDEELEELILAVADDFIESSVNAACHLAKHRKSNILEAKDLLLHLERNYNMWTPGYGTDELRTFKKAPTAEAHRQRMALIRKTLKKY
ncbi:transcription initiation factor TFIID subunit 12-like [Artemia franciscana]|uniref:transcription initiation factor TFIID subunit 12-like n=1 Tax=Artemia franciscana TaxID=6661 RepID=UPI0032DB8619